MQHSINHMFNDMFSAYEQGTEPQETFYDGYIVNAIMDAAYASVQSKKWEPVKLDIWRGSTEVESTSILESYDDHYYLIKEEILPGGAKKLILKDKTSGKIIERRS